MPEIETPEQVLSAAARLLEERGWCRIESEPNGPYTVDDAIEIAANGDVDLAGRAVRVLAGWLICAERGPTFWMSSARQVVTRWNDRKNADKAEVLAALGRAAASRLIARTEL